MSKTLTLAVWGRSRCRGRPQPRRRCWEPASGTQRGFPSVGSAWLAGATRVYTPRLPNAMSERISGEDWGPLPPPNARTRRGAVTCRTRAGARRSLRVRQRSPNRACRQSFEAPEERARRRAQNAAARRAGLGNAGKGALLKTGGAGCGEEPTSGSGRRGHRALDVSARPQATDEPDALRRGGIPRSPVYPQAVRRAPPPSSRPGYGRGPARPTVPALCPSPRLPSRPERGGRDALSRSPAPRASEAGHTHPPHGAGTVLAGLCGAGARRRGGSAAQLARRAALPPPAHACAAAGEPADRRAGAGRGGGFPAAGSSGPPPPACLARGPPAPGAFLPGRGGPTFLAARRPSPSRGRASPEEEPVLAATSALGDGWS